MSLSYPARLSLAQIPTPLQYLKITSEQLGGPRLWLKRDDLTGSLLSGNKIRKLEFVLGEALAQGCDTLITCGGVQSNHCRATALVGAQLGLKVCLILREDSNDAADGNLLLSQLSGADIHIYSPREYRTRQAQLFVEHQNHYESQGRKVFCIPTGASDGIGVWGYLAACEELQKDFQTHSIEPEWILCATGSGGTQAGLTLGAHHFNLGAKVLGVAVCDSEDYFHNKVRQDLRDWSDRYASDFDLTKIKSYVNANYIGPGYAKADAEIFKTIATVAANEGVIFDPVYTGKAFHGLLEEIKKGTFNGCKDLVFIHTGGVFGLFPQRHHFQQS